MDLPIVIWIDSSQAKIFKFYEHEVTQTHMKPHGPIHHSQVEGKNHTQAEGDIDKFYYEVIDSLKKESLSTKKDFKLLILGSGLGHTHFYHHIKESYPDLAKNILDSKKTKFLTDPQIIAKGRNFFIKAKLISE